MINNETRNELMEELLKHPIGPDEGFEFHCTMCGQCCKNRNDILLSPYDLCRMATGLGISLIDVVDKYGEVYIGESSKIPLVALKMRDDNGKCPFLCRNSCKIHVYKPTVCALFPLGRAVARYEEENKNEINYILQPTFCGKRDEVHTPRDWMESFNLEESEKWFFEWQDSVLLVSEKIRELINVTPSGAMNIILSNVFNILYLNYKQDKTIIEQTKKNKELTLQMLDIVHNTIEDYMNA